MGASAGMWGQVLILAIGVVLIIRALLANRTKRRATSADVLSLTYALEAGGTAHLRKQIHTIARARGCTDEQVTIMLLEAILKRNKRDNESQRRIKLE